MKFSDSKVVDAQSCATSPAQSEVHTDRAILYSANSSVLLKPGYYLTLTQHHSITEDDIKDDHCYSVSVTLFPSFDDCLTFCRRAGVTVHRDAVAIMVDSANLIHSEDGQSIIKPSDEHFSALISYLQRETYILSKMK